MNKKTKFLFIDESGNFDFSSSGSKYFVLTGILSEDPSVSKKSLLSFKYKSLQKGFDLEYFHASEDRQIVRDKVFSYIKSDAKNINIFSVVINKKSVNKLMYTEKYMKRGKSIERVTGHLFYQNTCLSLFKMIQLKRGDNLVVILGSLFTKEKHSLILGTIKKYLKSMKLYSYRVYFHQTKSDINSQLADYCCWAIFVKHEREEIRPYQAISGKIVQLLNITVKK